MDISQSHLFNLHALLHWTVCIHKIAFTPNFRFIQELQMLTPVHYLMWRLMISMVTVNKTFQLFPMVTMVPYQPMKYQTISGKDIIVVQWQNYFRKFPTELMRFNKNIDIEFMAQPPSDTPKAKNTRKPTNLILVYGNRKPKGLNQDSQYCELCQS